jgi:hypothetical protein
MYLASSDPQILPPMLFMAEPEAYWKFLPYREHWEGAPKQLVLNVRTSTSHPESHPYFYIFPPSPIHQKI